MCGRYYRQSDKQKIAETFHVARWAPDVHLAPDYNIAPSTFQPIIRSSPEDGEREVVLMRWGLIPEKIADPDSFKTCKGPVFRSRLRSSLVCSGIFQLQRNPLQNRSLAQDRCSSSRCRTALPTHSRDCSPSGGRAEVILAPRWTPSQS